ncbi:PhzF family phenazine biosynthesis protein [Mucilaginibacter psychrotolerans]|uniref:PhzF family phenazine biosynthesis protein n=1 Tax=Mucilaginibacter psychrotolerans TaxID=1524096 RepID=A0A4Y8S4L8_9SPHI|nr:PhzF family phenazine biosynthesis protein [Mucilaginibacter psychrotolerans]TFF33575.1 PhzF family phenazine biosynthesis protein [Mucilaginibacter psychrotolerans]
MTIPIYQADAFTDKLFGGNPAAVCPLTEWLPDAVMQNIALENNLAETAFFVKNDTGYMLRWFTPELEIDLCGHATLATAHIIFTELGHEGDTIYFDTKQVGTLIVKRDGDKYTLDFPSRPPIAVDAPEGLLASLGGKTPLSIWRSRDYMLVYENEEDIAELTPNHAALAKIDTIGVIVTAPGKEVDFVSRFFAPAASVPEDPVTGSAHCNLIPYWADRLGKNQLHAYQISPRKGELWCELKGDRVLMTGNAVTYLKGEIYV